MSKVFLITILINTTNAFMPTFLNTKFSNSRIYMDGKGFGGGEATRDPNPTIYNPDDPKGKQTAIFKAESFNEYLARRNPRNTHGAQTGQEQIIENKVKSGVTKNAESYAQYMAKRKAKYMSKFGKPTEIYDRGQETDN